MPITLLDYPLDEPYLFKLYETYLSQSEPYVDARYPGSFENWQILRLEPHFFAPIFADLGISGSPRFYHLKKNTKVPPHVDNKTLCSINFILGDSDPAPIRIEGKEYFYRQAVLNTQKMHEVHNGNSDRLLFKISIFDKTYDEVVSMIRYKK